MITFSIQNISSTNIENPKFETSYATISPYKKFMQEINYLLNLMSRFYFNKSINDIKIVDK